MKTLKIVILSLVIMVAYVTTKASAIIDDRHKLTATFTVDTYINALKYGRIADLPDIFDDNLKYSMVRGTETQVFTKHDILGYFNDMEGIEQNCAIKTTVNDMTPDVIIAKVDMLYPTFTRTNYVTMVDSENGWKITNVYSTAKKTGKK